MNEVDNVLLEEIVFLESSSRERWQASIRIGSPEQVRDRRCFCKVSTTGLIEERTIAGATPLNTLVLAFHYIAHKLFEFEAGGGQIFSRHGESLPGRLVFGRLWSSEGLADAYVDVR